MFRLDTHSKADRVRRTMPGVCHTAVREVLPFGEHRDCEHGAANIAMANGLVLWAVVTLVGVVAWRELQPVFAAAMASIG